MPDFVIRANIQRFESMLATELDPAKRKSIEALLAAERAKLELWLQEQRSKAAE